ncbi:MAG: preprotein translocase subunit SecE [Actinomycetales bacterium]
MTETAASSSEDRPASKSAKTGKAVKKGFFARMALFVRQVIAEMRKVVTPTRKELINYTLVVLVFVAIMMAIVTGLDLAFGKAVLWIFGGSGPVEH